MAEFKAGGSGAARARFPVGSCFRCSDPGHFQRECPKMAEYPLISGVEHVGMKGVDGVNVSPYTCEGGENVSPEEDKCISNTRLDAGKPRREMIVLVLSKHVRY